MKTKTITQPNCIVAKLAHARKGWQRHLFIGAFLIVTFVPTSTNAQAYLYHYQKLLDNQLDVKNHTLTRTADDHFLVAAGFNNSTWWNYPDGIALYKLDADLNIIWNMAYAPVDPMMHTFVVEDLIESGSGDIVVCGSLQSHAFRSSRAFVARFTPDGNMLWLRMHSPGLSFTSIVERPDQAGFMACGDARYLTNIEGLVCWMDEQGQPIWAYRMPAQVSGTRTRYEEIIITDNGSLVVGNINFAPNWPNPSTSEVLLSRFSWDGIAQYHTVYRSAPDSVFRHVPVAKSLVASDSAVFITGAVMGDSLLKDSIVIDSVIGSVRMFHDVLIMAVDLATGWPFWQNRYNTSEQWFFDQYVNDEWGEKILIRHDSLVVCGHSITYHNIYNPSRDGFLLRTSLNGWPAPHTHFGDTMQDYLYDMVLDADTIHMAGYSNTLNISRNDIYLVEWFPVVTDTCLYETHITPFWNFNTVIDSVFWHALDCIEEPVEMHEEAIDVLEPVLCDKVQVQIYPRMKEPVLESLRLYPNPASDAVFVTSTDDSIYQVHLFNIYGGLVAEHKMLSGESFPIGQYPPGTYIVRVVSETEGQQIFKLIIR